MKNIIAAKMGAMRKRSALSSSAASSLDITTTQDGVSAESVPNEPSAHRGKMRVGDDVVDVSSSSGASEDFVSITLHVAMDAVHAVTDSKNSIVFEAGFAMLREIIWDHTECSLCFVTEDGTRSASFVFTSLVEVEAQITTSLRSASQRRVPDQVYVGVLVGRNVPSSPIHQRRASVYGAGAPPPTTLSAPLRRELLVHERPPRSISSREKLALQYFRSGILSFACSIHGDLRGLKLDANFLYVFPSPDGYDRSACLFSYQYAQVDACEVRGGVRLELRFRRSGAKQPTFIAFQSSDAQYIRDAIWYLKHGMSVEEYFRSALTKSDVASVSASTPVSPRLSRGRRNSLQSFQDEDALWQRVQSRCVVIGCTRRCADLTSTAIQEHRLQIGSDGTVKRRSIWLCEEHGPTSTLPSSPPHSPSKRHGLLSRGKSSVSMASLFHTKHYLHSVMYHGTLLKRGGKYQMTKAWHPKIVALIGTPLGGFLCYYDKLAHCPGLSEAVSKERRVIDLSGVLCVRRESAVSKGSSPPPFAFDVVTVYRTWTFAASDSHEYELWLHVLGDAIEKQSSMAPNTPLRFPVKCLRDPLQNLPSRNDGTTTLEVSPNGVTICSGTEGESEVYNWYFTEIQKWSVAKQHDNSPCCFLSCAVDPADGAMAQSGTPMRYQDFLFQTPDADAVCRAIEFFVGRCMAKLETLGLMHLHTSQSRQSSRRPSVDPSFHSLSTASVIDERNSKCESVNEHLLVVVPLRPVGVAPSVVDSECAPPAEPQPAAAAHISTSTPTLEPIEITAITVSVPETPTMTEKGDLEQWVKYKSTRPAPAEECRRIECITSVIVADMPDVAHHSPSKTEDTMQSDVTDSAEEVATLTSIEIYSSVELSATEVDDGEQGDCNDGRETGGVDDTGTLSTSSGIIDTMGQNEEVTTTYPTQKPHEPSTPIVSLEMPLEDDIAITLWTEELGHNRHEGQPEGDGDRFESFEYCDCTVGTNSVPTEDENESARIDGPLCGDEEFEDAQCETSDSAEASVVLLDGCYGNDEDSAIVLEDDEPSSSAVDAIGGARPNYDPVDEIDTHPTRRRSH